MSRSEQAEYRALGYRVVIIDRQWCEITYRGTLVQSSKADSNGYAFYTARQAWDVIAESASLLSLIP